MTTNFSGPVSSENGFNVETVTNANAPVTLSIVQDDIAAAAGGAISVVTHYTTIASDAGGDAFTLADGSVVGQLKRIVLIADGGGDAVITPATYSDGTTLTMADAGDYALLTWTAAGWVGLEYGNTVDGISAPAVT